MILALNIVLMTAVVLAIVGALARTILSSTPGREPRSVAASAPAHRSAPSLQPRHVG